MRKNDSYFPAKSSKISTTETPKMTTTSTDANKDEEEHQMHEKRVSQVLRELKIKTGVLRRLSKEREMYEREVLDFTTQIEKDEIDRNDDDDEKTTTTTTTTRDNGNSAWKSRKRW